MNRSILIDTNLLILLIVGLTSAKYIGKHKRLQKYTIQDFETLIQLIDHSNLIVIPHVLAETSNLLANIDEPIKSQIFVEFRRFVERHDERQVPSQAGMARLEFSRLGLADAILLEAVQREARNRRSVILTDDLALAVEAGRVGLKCLNFNHRPL